MVEPLAEEIKLLVDRHGFKAVKLELRRLEAEQRPVSKLDRDAQTKVRRRNGRAEATEYVGKMDIDDGRRPAVLTLAGRFEAKSFLPSCADISNFCTIYGIAEPASRSRAAAIPRVFKHLATMDAKDVEALVTNNAFSGPSQLGPISEAIRRYGRAARNVGTKER